MPYYEKSEDWLHQSALLLQARPSTTRITTRYHLKPARRTPKPPKSDSQDATTTTQQQKPAQKPAQEGETRPPRGHLVLKTYDPASGVTLKYKTSKAAEVTRLVQMLGTLGRRMAGVAVPDQAAAAAGGQDEVMADAAPAEGAEAGGSGSGVQTPVGGGGGAAAAGQSGGGQGGGGGGGKGKKKKGKR